MALTTKTNIGTKFSTVAESTRASVTAIPRENEPVIVVDSEGKRIGLCFGDGYTQLKDLEMIGGDSAGGGGELRYTDDAFEI